MSSKNPAASTVPEAPAASGRWARLAGWLVCLGIGMLVTWAMSEALIWGGLSFMLVAFAMPLAITWFVLPPARTYRLHRWLAVLFISTQTAYPFTVFASTVAIGWIVHRLYLVEFVDDPKNKILSRMGPLIAQKFSRTP